MSTLLTTNLKNPSSGSNNIVLGTDGSTTIPTLSATTITGTGTLNVSSIKNPSSGSNNIVLGTDGSTTIPTLSATTITGTSVRGGITSSTSVASTSGTSIDFTDIPSWVKRVTVMFSGVSLSGTSSFLLQVGTSGGVVNTGYSGGGARYGGNAIAAASGTTGISPWNITPSATYSGHAIWTLVSGNIWTCSLNFGVSGGTESGCMAGGSVTLSGTLDRVRITTSNGTDTFDAGSINILYEG